MRLGLCHEVFDHVLGLLETGDALCEEVHGCQSQTSVFGLQVPVDRIHDLQTGLLSTLAVLLAAAVEAEVVEQEYQLCIGAVVQPKKPIRLQSRCISNIIFL